MNKDVVYIDTHDGFIDAIVDGKSEAFIDKHNDAGGWITYRLSSLFTPKGNILDEKYLKLRGIPLYEKDK